ncbi:MULTISPECIES: alpha/beta hydrolase [unclassified Isoptericola]|uniref:alpha/beta hydrolase n=1 Tax=unclassified Isoptericola TaxID=2623355 RepID=UPI0036492F2A
MTTAPRPPARTTPLPSAATTDPNRWWWEEGARAGGPTTWGDLATEAPGVEEEPSAAPPGRWLRSPVHGSGAVLAIHGGGFVSGYVATHRRLFGHLALATRVPVFALEYGLVPDHVYPSQVEEAVEAFRWLRRRHRTVAVVGDSCGATLALTLAVRLRDAGAPGPAALLLMSPWADLEAHGASYDSGRDPFFTRELVRSLAAGYLAGTDPWDPRAAPLHARLDGLPSTLVQVGGDEALLDDARALVTRLRAAGVAVRLEETAGALHTFQQAVGRSPAADRAVRGGAAWLRSTLAATATMAP